MNRLLIISTFLPFYIFSSCEITYDEKIPLFGDLHVHTALSLDAATQGTINRPDDAYRYAMGERISIQPYDENGNALRSSKLSQPLDFMAITDHAELLGEVHLCETSDSVSYNSLTCMVYRNFPKLAYFYMNQRASQSAPLGICGENRELCLEASIEPWEEIINAAEKYNDPKNDCSFTSFIGYEWTGARYSGSNLHRNVIFKNNSVPSKPISFYEATTREDLWDQLNASCTSDCDYVVIPHNSNLSNGLIFEDPELKDYQMISKREPLIEIFQHKGSSECIDENDPYCDFELLSYADFGAKFLGSDDPIPKESFARYALSRGQALKEKNGTNPFKIGFIGSTDTHLAIPGATDEATMPGHGGAGKSLRDKLPKGLPDDIEFNPGGLAVVWAKKNNRDEIFQSLLNREAYATSGPRYIVRFFAGEDISLNSCNEQDAVNKGYQNGVPMGGTLENITNKPTFFFSAKADANDSNQFISAIQIIKSSFDNGDSVSEIITLHESSDAYDLDLDKCVVNGPKQKNFCGVWRDENHSPNMEASYYLRVISAPTCRWSHQLCMENDNYCEKDQGNIPKFVQERAWTSPIWIEKN